MTKQSSQKIVHVHLGKDDVFKTTLTAGNHELLADEPDNVPGGNDSGPDPYDYLLMSLGSCTAMTVKMYARRKKWPLEELFLEMRHSKSHDLDCTNCEIPDAKIDVIEKELIIKGDLSQEQLDKLLEISKKCPVHKTLVGELQIESILSMK